MGDLVINHLTFSFDELENNRHQSLFNFLEAGKQARNAGDHTHSTEELYSFQYKWGDFQQDFAYANLRSIESNPHLSWIPQVLHQSFQNFFFQNPSGRSDFQNIIDFKRAFADAHHGTIGCSCSIVNDLDVSDLATWHIWKIKYLQSNPHKYFWKASDDDFLPNKMYSDKILEQEIERHKKSNEIVDKKIGQAFHDHVMRPKGPELRAYAVAIGTKIAESNYYIWDEELSGNEQRKSGSPRKIFSFLDRNGNKMYISIDHAHGMFEYHNDKGEHLGEFKFDGTYNADSDFTHNLKTL